MPTKKSKDAKPNFLLKRARIECGWSQKDVALRISTPEYFIAEYMISRWESGLSFPGHYYRKKLCDAFGMNEADLGLVKKKYSQVPPGLPLPICDSAIPSNFSRADDLVGQKAALKMINQYLCKSGVDTTVVLHGLPGVGKTTLAVEFVNDLQTQKVFSGGIFWAGVGLEANVTGIFHRWGKLLGISDIEMSSLHSIHDWKRVLGNAIGKRRMLFIIDDVWSVQDADALKLYTPYCAFLVTTRSLEVAKQLAGEKSIRIEELSEEESIGLLRRLAPSVIEDEQDDARLLVQSVGGLPLALTLMGNYLLAQSRYKQQHRIRKALKKLYNVEERLTLSSIKGSNIYQAYKSGAKAISIKSVIQTSYEQLDNTAKKALCSLALFIPKPNTFSKEAALEVATITPDVLNYLTNSSLVESDGRDRYMLHQVIVDYIRLHQMDAATYKRMVQYFVNFTEMHKEHFDILDREMSNIFMSFEIAHKQELMPLLMQGIKIFVPFLIMRGYYEQAEKLLDLASKDIVILGHDALDKSIILLNSGGLAEKRGRYQQAQEYLKEGLHCAKQINDYKLICQFLTTLGDVAIKQSEFYLAEKYFQQSLCLAEHLKYNELQGILLADLGEVACYFGKNQQAEQFLERGLHFIRQFQRHEQLSAALSTLGMLAIRKGNYLQAEIYLQEGLASAHLIGHREMISNILRNLGAAAIYQGNYPLAEKYYQEGLNMANEIENYELSVSLLINLGDFAMNCGAYKDANLYLEKAKSLMDQMGHEDEYVRLITLGEIAIRCGDYELAEEWLQIGLKLARDIGEVEGVIAGLTNLCEIAIHRGMYTRVETLLEEALRLARASQHPLLVALLAYQGELAAIYGDYEQASSALQEGLELARSIGYLEKICVLLNNTAELAIQQDHYMCVGELLEEGLLLARKIQNPWYISCILITYGNFHLIKGELEDAQKNFHEVQDITQNIIPLRYADALYGLALIAEKQGDYVRAFTQGTESKETFKKIDHCKIDIVERWLTTLLRLNPFLALEES